eukprot:120756_1
MNTDYVELVDVGNKITKSSLYDLHQIRLSNKINNDNNIDNIVNALGGIDSIVSYYSNNNIACNQMELPQMQNDNMASFFHQRIFYTFKANNTLLHLFVEMKTANTIIKYAYNKLLITLMFIAGSIFFAWIYASNDSYTEAYYIYKACFLATFAVWKFFIILSININALKCILQSFLFWFKTWLALKHSALFFILVYRINKYQQHFTWVEIFGNILTIFTILFIIIISCTMDGIHVKRRYKILCLVMISLWFSSLAIKPALNAPKDDTSVIHIGSITYSVYAAYADTIIVLVIFLYKQTILLIMKPNLCINITISPYKYSVGDSVVNYLQTVVNYGGIDRILSDYLSPKNEINFSAVQLKRIHEILISNNEQHFTVIFQTNNSIIMFGVNNITKLNEWIFKQVLLYALMIITFVQLIWGTMFSNAAGAIYDLYKLFAVSALFIWFILILLTSNSSAFKSSLFVFPFWYKQYLAWRFCVYWLLLEYYCNFYGQKEMSFIRIFGNIIGLMNTILIVLICCVMDGIYCSVKGKILIGLTVSIYYSMKSLFYVYNAPINDLSVISIGSISFSAYTEVSNSVYVLSIFLWKQTLLLIFRPRKCINIIKRPYFRWE